jgi:hypothetical protein
MAIVALNARQDVVDGGLAAAYQGSLSASDTYTFPNDGKTFLHVKKSGAGSCTATIITPATLRGKSVTDTTVTIPASTGDKMIGPFPPDLYNDPATGLASVTFSEITGLTVAVLRLP